MIRIVIADDEETIREGIKNLLIESGLDCTVEALAKDGEEALQLIEKIRPEIVLLDINMPKRGGLDIIETIMQMNPLCKILIISGYDEFEYAQRALKLGVFDYLLKPVNIATLKTTVKKAIDQYQSRLWEVNRLNQQMAPVGEMERNLDEVLPYIQKNYVNPDLSLQDLAEHFHTSSSYLSRLIKKNTGVSFLEILLQLRMEQAKKLLQEEKSHMIYEVATLVGYSSQHYFCRSFKEYTGVSPSDYRANSQNATNGLQNDKD